MIRRHRREAAPLPLVRAIATWLCAALAVAGCAAPRVIRSEVAGGGRSPSSVGRPATATTVAPTTAMPPTTTTEPEEPGWTTLSTGPRGIAIDERTVVESDGAQVTVARFLAGHVDYSLHVGSEDPPRGGAVVGPDSGPAVGAAELPLLLACFNGGFQSSTGAGGFEVDGQVLVPLRAGLASFVIDAAGVGQVGVWGANLPRPGTAVASVRQNLTPLVWDGQPNSQVGDVGAWGATLGGRPVVARSALGEDLRGDLLFAGSMAALPVDLADALVASGATVAMELDINPEWVQLATATSPGGALAARIPGQVRPADQCQVGWTRDFVAVLSVG